jgi:hypothetical protein
LRVTSPSGCGIAAGIQRFAARRDPDVLRRDHRAIGRRVTALWPHAGQRGAGTYPYDPEFQKFVAEGMVVIEPVFRGCI